MSTKVVIVEDEFLASERLKNLLGKVDAGIEVIAVLDSVSSAIAWFGSNPQPDLAFFDIQLGDGISFSILDQIPFDPQIIFTTAYDDYALQAIKNSAVDYLLKPVKLEELKIAFEKFKVRTKEPDLTALLEQFRKEYSQDRFLDRFKVQAGSHLRVLQVSEIAYFFVQNKIVYAMDKQGKRHAINHSMDQLDDGLDPSQFYRVNRQLIIHIGSIVKMHSYTKSRVKLLLQPAPDFPEKYLITSVERSGDFKKWLDGIRY